jgi:hypothetical protein
MIYLLFFWRKVCGPILGIYKSLTDAWRWKLGLRPRNSQKGICKWDFRCSATAESLYRRSGQQVLLLHGQCWESHTSHITQSPGYWVRAAARRTYYTFLIHQLELGMPSVAWNALIYEIAASITNCRLQTSGQWAHHVHFCPFIVPYRIVSYYIYSIVGECDPPTDIKEGGCLYLETTEAEG